MFSENDVAFMKGALVAAVVVISATLIGVGLIIGGAVF